MPLFGRRKEKDEQDKPASPAATPASNGAGGGENAGGKGDRPAGAAKKFTPEPEKAQRFFQHAKTVHETTNYEYAMKLWLDGLKRDPANLTALEGFFQSAAAFLQGSGGKRVSREISADFSGRSELERWLSAILAWSQKPTDAVSAVVAAEAAAALGIEEQTYWIGERAMVAVARDRNPRKDLLVRLKDTFTAVGAFDKAVDCGNLAVRLDPSDSDLSIEIRNLSARATMARGGYENTGQTGGFLANVRDLDKQRQLEEEDRVVKTDETLDRLLKSAEAEYRARPADPPAILAYVKRLLERGTPEDEKRAYTILMQAFRSTKQFRFRQQAGDIQLRVGARKLGEYRARAEAAPQDATAQENFRKASAQFRAMEIEEFKSRVEAYPTDLGNKYELARRFFETQKYDEAIPLFQEASGDAKLRVPALNQLGQCFLNLKYTDEAIHTFREAMESHKVNTDEMGMELRYGLMTALQARAESERDPAAADEADRLASGIIVQQITYRDVRTRRDAIKKLVQELKKPGA